MSKNSKNAFDYASLLAEKFGAELILVNVFDAFERVGGTKKKLEEIAETLRKDSSEKLEDYVNEARKVGVTNLRAERMSAAPRRNTEGHSDRSRDQKRGFCEGAVRVE